MPYYLTVSQTISVIYILVQYLSCDFLFCPLNKIIISCVSIHLKWGIGGRVFKFLKVRERLGLGITFALARF